MHYFYLQGQALAVGTIVSLADKDINHAFRVLRLKSGDHVVVSDGLGRALLGRIESSYANEILVALLEELSPAESPLQITLVQSLVKGDKMDLIVRQAVELGVRRIIPVLTERSVPQRSEKQDQNRLLRWRNIVRSASAQCRRAFLAEVEEVSLLQSLQPRFQGMKTLVCWEEDASLPLAEVLRRPSPPENTLFCITGPEGGFSRVEIEALQNSGAEAVSLGQRILRSETAAVAALVMIQAAWGDLSAKGECR